MNEPLILVVEDDKSIRNFVGVSLKANGYKYIETSTGDGAICLAASHSPAVIILDLGLPDIDGLEVIERVRQWSTMPIIVISARGQEREKVQALDIGADDYITKPFGIEEMLARIRVALRNRNNSQESESAVFRTGNLVIDYTKRRVEVDNEEIHLTPIEYKIICLMSKNPGKVLTHNFIQKNVWGAETNDPRSLRVFVAGLRRKIEKTPIRPSYIATIAGVGYRFNGD